MTMLFNKIANHFRYYQTNVLLVGGFVLAIAGLLYLHFQTQIDEDWDQFRIEHNCKVIRSVENGHQKSAWICDDGKEYYRWRQQK